MKIGSIEYPEFPVFLAPMEEVTDSSFRRICKGFGADMLYTEFVSSDALIRDIPKTLKKTDFLEEERPIGIQIYGSKLESMVDAAKVAAKANPDLIDINFGCPVKKIVARFGGSGMLQNIPLMLEITSAIVKSTNLPVTVKTRLGWDEKTKNIVSVAEQLQDVGIQALTLHGRTRSQMYNGEADWTLIGEVKNNPRMHIPIIGNGDITSAQKAIEYQNRYGVDAIMVGRGSIGNPWIFKEIKHLFHTGQMLDEPTIHERVEVLKKHIELTCELKGEGRSLTYMKKHYTSYFKGYHNVREYRMKLFKSLDFKEVYDVLEEMRMEYNEMKIESNFEN